MRRNHNCDTLRQLRFVSISSHTHGKVKLSLGSRLSSSDEMLDENLGLRLGQTQTGKKNTLVVDPTN